MLKKMIAILLITALLPLCVLAESVTALTAGERAALDRLAGQQDELAAKLMDDNGDIADIYPNLSGQMPAGTDAFPERFDLRDLGVVPAVKQQYPWGTCWAVVSTAAFETSLLSMMGLTVTEYREKFGLRKRTPLICKSLARERREMMKGMKLWERKADKNSVMPMDALADMSDE